MLALSVPSVLGSDLRALFGSMPLFMAVGALLVEEEWANHLAARAVFHIVALILLLGTACIKADLAEGCLGSSLVALAAVGAGIATVVVLSGCVHRVCSKVEVVWI